MKRYCDGCRRHHDLDAFDLEGDESNSTCRAHAHKRAQSAEAEARKERQLKIASIERQRRTHIAALVKLDAELAELRGAGRGSSPFKRVDPEDVLEGGDGDLGFGD